LLPKKRIFLLVFFTILVVGILLHSKLFYWFQTMRFKPYSGEVLTVQKSSLPSIFSDSIPKVWVHHVNNIIRLQKLLPDFNGIECDVYYNTAANTFEVYHDSSEVPGPQLEQYLQLPNTSSKYFWFDFKNLDTVNVLKALQLFNQYDSLYHIKQRVIIESTKPPALKQIADAGYFTSYYVPPFNLAEYGNINRYVELLKKDIYPKFQTISQGEETIRAIDTLLPGIKKLTWITSRKLAFLREPLQNFHNRKDIKVILVEILTNE
jgi:hypothetical protein